MRHYLYGTCGGIVCACLLRFFIHDGDFGPAQGMTPTSAIQDPPGTFADEAIVDTESLRQGDSARGFDPVIALEGDFLRGLEELVHGRDYEHSIRSLIKLMRLSYSTSLNRTQRWVAIREAIEKLLRRVLAEGVSASEVARILSECKTLEGFYVLGSFLADSSPADGLEIINAIENVDEALRLSKGFLNRYFKIVPSEEPAYWRGWIKSNLTGEFQSGAYVALSSSYLDNERFEDAFEALSDLNDQTIRFNYESNLLFQVGSNNPERGLQIMRNRRSINNDGNALYSAFFQNLLRSDPSLEADIRPLLNPSELLIFETIEDG